MPRRTKIKGVKKVFRRHGPFSTLVYSDEKIMDPFPDLKIDECLRDFLNLISDKIVAIGSVARKTTNPNDLDLLWDMNSSKARKVIENALTRTEVKWHSAMIGNFIIGEEVIISGKRKNRAIYGLSVELLGFHYGPSYATCRRGASWGFIAGVQLPVALARHAPKKRAGN